MNKKQMYVQVINLETGKIFSLPTLYTDRVEACVCGQNYIRDRQAEDRFTPLFFRVMISYNGKVAEPFIINDDDEDDEEPEHGESVYGNAEEPSSESLAEILSEFSAFRPNY